jgi:hypothetical protein
MPENQSPTTPRTRKPAAKPEGDALIETAKNQLKEAKKLAKVIDTIKDLGIWALDRLDAASKARRESLAK